MGTLTTLPLELLVLVSSHLTTPDLGSLRQTCRTIETLLFDRFAEEFFTKKQFMLTQPSLQALVDISKHAGLSKQLKHVIIGLEQYTNPEANSGQFCRFSNEASALCYIKGWEDQKVLDITGMDRDLLIEAFRNLHSLEIVEIRDFVSPGRARDDNVPWTSYGAPTVYRETGVQLHPYGFGPPVDELELPAKVFQKLMYSLGKAKRYPSTFQVFLRRRGKALIENAFLFPDFMLHIVEPVFERLKNLLLNVNFTSRHIFLSGGLVEIARGQDFLPQLLAQTPHLTHLRLNFSNDQETLNQNFLHWLGSASASPRTTNPRPLSPAFPGLGRLDLGILRTDLNIIVRTIAKFAPTLRNLNLWRVTATPVLGVIHHAPYDQSMSLWSGFFRALSRVPGLKLKGIYIGKMAQCDGPRPSAVRKVEIGIPKTGQDPGEFEDGDRDDYMGVDKYQGYKDAVEHKGEDTVEFIKEIAKRVHVHWPTPPPTALDDESEDESEDPEDDESEGLSDSDDDTV